jgi:hypothetical protein
VKSAQKWVRPVNRVFLVLVLAMFVLTALPISQAHAAQPGAGTHRGYVGLQSWACYTLSASDPKFANYPGGVISLDSTDNPKRDQDLYLFTAGMKQQITKSAFGAKSTDTVLWEKNKYPEVWYCVYGYQAGNYEVRATPTGFY